MYISEYKSSGWWNFTKIKIIGYKSNKIEIKDGFPAMLRRKLYTSKKWCRIKNKYFQRFARLKIKWNNYSKIF